MPKSLADGKIKLSIMLQKPADPYHPTLTELTTGIDAACRVLSSNFKMGATASDTVDEKALCQEGNSKTFTTSNYEANFVAFRYFDDKGQPETAQSGAGGDVGDAVFQALKLKGTRAWIAKRFTSKSSLDPWAAGDEVEVYEVITDNPLDAELSGYIKKQIPMSVQQAWLNGTVAGAAGGTTP